MPTLDQAKPGDRLRIERMEGPPELTQRLMEFGVLEGDAIELIAFAPLGDPLEILIGATKLSLRKSDAAFIAVSKLS
jgi:ferrous iron transport protein A